MWAAWMGGARAAARRGRLVLALWLIGAGFGVAFAVASAAWLAVALDGSLATRTLLHDLDADVLVDLWFHHGEGLRMLVLVAALLAVVHTILWWGLHGVVVASVAPLPGSAWQAGLRLAPVMMRLWLLATAVLLLWTGAVAAPAVALLRATRESPAPLLWHQIGGAAAVAWLVGAVWLIAVHDHARLRAGLVGAGALAAWGWAAVFVAAGGRRAFPLALLLQVSAAALWSLYQFLSLALPLTELIGLTASLLLGQAFLVARTWTRVWSFAAQRLLHP